MHYSQRANDPHLQPVTVSTVAHTNVQFSDTFTGIQKQTHVSQKQCKHNSTGWLTCLYQTPSWRPCCSSLTGSTKPLAYIPLENVTKSLCSICCLPQDSLPATTNALNAKSKPTQPNPSAYWPAVMQWHASRSQRDCSLLVADVFDQEQVYSASPTIRRFKLDDPQHVCCCTYNCGCCNSQAFSTFVKFFSKGRK